MGSRFEDDKGPIGDWELVVMRDTEYDAEIAAAEERGRQEAATRITTLEGLLHRAASDLYMHLSAGVHSPDCPAWADDLLKAIEQEVSRHD